MTPEQRAAILARIDVGMWRVPDDGLLEYDPVHDEWRVEVYTKQGVGGPLDRIILRRYAGRRNWWRRAIAAAAAMAPVMSTWPTRERRLVFPLRSERITRRHDWDQLLGQLNQLPVMNEAQIRTAFPYLDPDYIGEPERDFDREQYFERYREYMHSIDACQRLRRTK